MKTELKNISINDLLIDGKISVRARNCCFNADLYSLYDVVVYYETGQSFLNIRNLGKGTCLELEEICIEYKQLLEHSSNTNEFNEVETLTQKQNEIENLIKTDILSAVNNKLIASGDIFSYLTQTQKIILKKKFEQNIINYSVRTKNRLKAIGYESFLINYLFTDNRNLLEIEGIGGKSAEEVIKLKDKLKDELIFLVNASEEEVSILKLILQNGEIILNDFVYGFYSANNHLPMFWILEHQLISSTNYGIKVLIDTLPIFKDYQYKTLEEVAKKYNLTRERVRQIRNGVFRRTFEIAEVLVSHKDNSDSNKYFELLHNKKDWTYVVKLIQEKNIVNQVSFEVEQILVKENCNFSLEFVFQIIGYIFKEEFITIGGFNKRKRDKYWKSTFLIRKKYAEIFDFEKLEVEFHNIFAENITDYLLDVEDFVANSQSWKKFDFSQIEMIGSIIREILLQEFGLYSDSVDGLIKIPANKGLDPKDVVYKILKQNGDPMHLEEIFMEFKKIWPSHKFTEAAQIRPWLQKHDSISFRNRSSIYTLKEWKHVRTGTIRDAIVEFLLKNKTPQNTSDITNYILEHFPKTNIASIRTTMQNDTQKRFSYYGKNLFGLECKEYTPEYKTSEAQGDKRKTFEQRLIEFEKFIIENEHYPFSSAEEKEEESLYRWWYRIVNNKQKISESQREEVERVQNQYFEYEIDKDEYEWDLNFNKMKLFLLRNGTAPSARNQENNLYIWYCNVKDDFLNDRLSDHQRKKYIELTKML